MITATQTRNVKAMPHHEPKPTLKKAILPAVDFLSPLKAAEILLHLLKINKDHCFTMNGEIITRADCHMILDKYKA